MSYFFQQESIPVRCVPPPFATPTPLSCMPPSPQMPYPYCHACPLFVTHVPFAMIILPSLFTPSFAHAWPLHHPLPLCHKCPPPLAHMPSMRNVRCHALTSPCNADLYFMSKNITFMTTSLAGGKYDVRDVRSSLLGTPFYVMETRARSSVQRYTTEGNDC